MGKKSKSKAKGKAAGPSRPQGRSKEEILPQNLLLTLPERIQNVKEFWRSLSKDFRQDMLTVKVSDLQKKADEETKKQQQQAEMEQQMYGEDTITIDLEPSPSETLQIGLERLKTRSTWKLWQWPDHPHDFLDAESFRAFVEAEKMDEVQRSMLPRDDGKPVEKPAEAQLRGRMSALLQEVHNYNRNLQDQEGASNKKSRSQRATTEQVNQSVQSANIELIMKMMLEFEKENEHLYRSVLFPITKALCELIDPQSRESKANDLSYDDFDKLHPDDVARFCEWLTEKVDGYSSKIKLEAKDLEEEGQEEGIGDVDLFTLIDDPEKGQCLVVNAKWLQHLQDRVLGEDGQPRKMKDGEDPDQIGLVLEWVYGTIVSTAEKARDGAKRLLGTSPPTVLMAFDMLDHALREQKMWEGKIEAAVKLQRSILMARAQSREYAKQFGDAYTHSRVPGQADADLPDLPDDVIKFMLNREVLLTEAKMMIIEYEKYKSDRKLRSLKVQMRQGEPEFERLKREMDELKSTSHRKLDGTYKTQFEMERQQTQQQDQQVEDQIKVQTEFREHSARLQSIFDERQRIEVEITRKVSEERQLIGWKDTVNKLKEKFDEVALAPSTPPHDKEPGIDDQLESGDADEETQARHVAMISAAASRSTSGQEASMQKLRNHFHKDVRRQFYSDEDDRIFVERVCKDRRAIEATMEDGRAVLQLLEMHLVNVACNDPGAVIGNQLILPLLQDRLDAAHRQDEVSKSEQRAIALLGSEDQEAQKKKVKEEREKERKRQQEEAQRAARQRVIDEQREREEQQLRQQEEEAQRLKDEEEKRRREKVEQEIKENERREKEMEVRRKELALRTAEWQEPILHAHPDQLPSLQISASHSSEPEASDSASGALDVMDEEGFTQHTARPKAKPKAQKPVDVPHTVPPGFRPRGPDSSHMRGRGRHPQDRQERARPSRVVTVPRRQPTHQQQAAPAESMETVVPSTPPAGVPPQSSQAAFSSTAGGTSTSQNSSLGSGQSSPNRPGSQLHDADPPEPIEPAAAGDESRSQSPAAVISSSLQHPSPGGVRVAIQQQSRPVEASEESRKAAHVSEENKLGVDSMASQRPEDAVEGMRYATVPETSGNAPQTPQQVVPSAGAEPPSEERTPIQSSPPEIRGVTSAQTAPIMTFRAPPSTLEGSPHGIASASGPPYPAGHVHGQAGPEPTAHVPLHHPGEASGHRPSGGRHSQPYFPPHPASQPPFGGNARRQPFMPPQGFYPSQRQLLNQAPQSKFQPDLHNLMMQPQPQANLQSMPMGGYPSNMPVFPQHHMDTGGHQQMPHPGQVSQYHQMGGLPQGHPFMYAQGKPRSSELPAGAAFGYSQQPVYGQQAQFAQHPGMQISQQAGISHMQHPGHPGPNLPHRVEASPRRHAQTLQSQGSLQSAPQPPALRSTPSQHAAQQAETPLNVHAKPFQPSRASTGSPGAISQSCSQTQGGLLFPATQASFPSLPPQSTEGSPYSHPRSQVAIPGQQSTDAAPQTDASRGQQTSPESKQKLATQGSPPSPQDSSPSSSKPSEHSGCEEPSPNKSTTSSDSSPAPAVLSGERTVLPADSEISQRSRSHQEARSSSESPQSTPPQMKAAQHWSSFTRPPSESPQTPQSSTYASAQLQSSRGKQKRSTPRTGSSGNLKQDVEVSPVSQNSDMDRRSTRAPRPQGSISKIDLPAASEILQTPRNSTTVGNEGWKKLQGEDLERLTLSSGLKNDYGTNMCATNVVVQALWHLRGFRERFLQLDLQDLARKGRPQEDLAVLNALRDLFNKMQQKSEGSEAKRIKLETQNSASEAASEIQPLSSQQMTRALLNRLLKEDANENSETSMRDPAETINPLLDSLQAGEVGPEGSAKTTADSIVFEMFTLHLTKDMGMEPDEEPEAKRSKSTSGAADTWHTQTARPHKVSQSHMSSQPNIVQTSGSQATQIRPEADYKTHMQHIPAQDFPFAPEPKKQTLVTTPRVFIYQVSFESLRASGSSLDTFLKAFEPRLKLSKVFGAVPQNCPEYEIQAITCFYSYHHKVFVYSFEIAAWLLIDDLEISKIGSFGDVKAAIKSGQLQPSLLFYEQV